MKTPKQKEKVHWSETVTGSKRLVQAYRQAPWRIQTQRGVLILIVTILGASILWVLVSVTVQAASAGLEIQNMESEQEELQRQIAGLKTEIGILTSSEKMEQRAEKLGFQPVSPEDITFVVVPGYRGRESQIKASPPGTTVEQPLVKHAYTESLWEWLLQGMLAISEQPGGSSP